MIKKVRAQFNWIGWVITLFCYGGAWQLCHSRIDFFSFCGKTPSPQFTLVCISQKCGIKVVNPGVPQRSPQRQIWDLLTVTRYKATTHGDVDDNDNDNNHYLEEQKDAEEGDCGRGSETKSRTSKECCELVQSLDHSSKTSCLAEHSLTSLRFPLPLDLLKQSLVAQTACWPTAMNSCSLPSSASPLWHYCLQWLNGGYRTAFKYIKHNFLNDDVGEQWKLLAGLLIFQSHSILHSYKILGGADFEVYNHRLI